MNCAAIREEERTAVERVDPGPSERPRDRHDDAAQARARQQRLCWRTRVCEEVRRDPEQTRRFLDFCILTFIADDTPNVLELREAARFLASRMLEDR